jgi:hypothetical protein
MKSWWRFLRIAALTVGVLLFGIVTYFVYWYSMPGTFEQRFDRIEVGMTEKRVQDIMGSDGDATGKKYRITGDERQRVWVVIEKGTRLEIVVVFDGDSRVATKDIYKTIVIINELFKDL